MGSRREEERNERIIRGLMKLPPNRHCINCNSLGPQYVCTNFWTFVCMTCSGIHREFTHRVKSVSMSKFTSQEVEALQNGGNQRAREIYLKDWDLQRQRLPANSNVDKVREFIKSVYVDKRYAGGKSADKPPRDLQRLGSNEDDTRRASSYHSYSQSPPYDFQYEDRRYGKQAAVLTRKPGSERGLFAGKMSSFISSPTRLSDRSLEDRFANEGSVPRFSDYSVSSGGDPSRSGVESPNFQKDGGFSSPPVQSSRNIVGEDSFSEAHFRRDANGIPPRQRTSSLGSVSSFGSNSMSQKSYNSGNLADSFSEPEQTAQAHEDNMSAFPQASSSGGQNSLNLFEAPNFPEPGTSPPPPIDLFQLPTSQSTSVDLFQASSNSAPSVNLNPSSLTSVQLSVDLFPDISQPQPATRKDEIQDEPHKDEGWATFDTQFPVAVTGTTNFSLESPLAKPSGMHSTMHEQISSLNTMQWPPYQNSNVQSSSSVSDPWHQNFHAVQSAGSIAGGQTWNAFDGPSVDDIKEVSKPHAESFLPLSTTDQYLGQRFLEGSNKDGIQGVASYGGFPGPNGLSEFAVGSSYAASAHPPTSEDTPPHQTDHKSTNPFDIPYDDSVLEPDNMFMDMNSLHAALPSVRMPSPFIDSVGLGQPWFPEDPATTYLPAGPQGALAYMERQTPNPQLTNVRAQGPVASVGGNPFA